MTKSTLATINLTVDLNSANEFGCKITNVTGMPAGWEFGATTSMKRHSVLPLKPVKAAKPTEASSAPVVANEASVQAVLGNPNLLAALQSFMAAQGTAPAKVETPTLAEARKPGRPRKA